MCSRREGSPLNTMRACLLSFLVVTGCFTVSPVSAEAPIQSETPQGMSWSDYIKYLTFGVAIPSIVQLAVWTGAIYLNVLMVKSMLNSQDDTEQECIRPSPPLIDECYIGHIPEEVEDIIQFTKNPVIRASYKQCGLTPPKGVVLYGPPGTGKTSLARHIAHSINAPFFVVRVSDIVSPYIGLTSKNIAGLFAAARQAAQLSSSNAAVICFDEFDGLAGIRNSGDLGVSQERNSYISTLLTEIGDNLESHDVNIIVVATTNRVDSIDPALLRKGRLGLHIYVGLPSVTTISLLIVYYVKKYVDQVHKHNSTCSPAEVMELAELLHQRKIYCAGVADLAQRAMRELIRNHSPYTITAQMMIATMHKLSAVR